MQRSVSKINYTSWDPEGAPPVLVDIQFTPELTVTAEGSIGVNTWLIDKLPFGMSSAVVNSEAQGKKKKIAVALVIDLSGSMDDYVIDQEEQCESDDQGEDVDCTESKKKYEYLRDSAKEFIQGFGAFLDATVIVTFSSNANPVFAQASALSPTDIQELMDDFNLIYPGSPSANFRVGGGTNMALALRKARVRLNDILDEPGWEDAFPVMILLSDGAPTTCSEEFPCKDELCASLSSCDGGFGWDRDTAPHMTFVINQTDRIREEDGITIFSVGIGAPAPDSEDPYQVTCNSSLLKSYFLRRLSNDPEGWEDAGQFDEAIPSCVEKSYNDIVDQHHGIYVQSYGSNLSPILSYFGQKILTRISN